MMYGMKIPFPPGAKRIQTLFAIIAVLFSLTYHSPQENTMSMAKPNLQFARGSEK